MDALTYAGYLGRVDAILDCRGSPLQSQDFAFGWHEAFVASEEPETAVSWALAKARGQARHAAELPMDGTDYHQFSEE